MKGEISLNWLKQKILKRDFVMTYEEAIALGYLTPVQYNWIKQAGTGTVGLVSIEIPAFSHLMFMIKDGLKE